MTIQTIHALEILDSRGIPTLKVTVTTSEGNIGQAMVPSGASTGKHEALELRDSDSKRYKGKGVCHAIQNVNGPIFQALKGESIFNQTDIDQKLIALDGTPNKHHLGANAIIGVSLAVAKAAAATHKKPLYLFLGTSSSRRLPCPMMNILNGGAHADNDLDFQEFMIRPVGASTFREAIRYGSETFHSLKSLLHSQHLSTAVGDEGGFAPNVPSNEAALELLMQAIQLAGFTPGRDITISLDVAASEFYENGFYIEKKRGALGKKKTTEEQIDYLEQLARQFPIDSIEDGLDQNDWSGWQLMTKRMGSRMQIVGDDLFVTNTKFLQKGIELHAANALLVKFNQIGTLSETIAAIQMAKHNQMQTIISHRSGETEDTTIADLSVAFQMGQIKTGSLSRSERTAKYNRLLEIEEELGKDAIFHPTIFRSF